jgi:hypothetical protein
MSQVPSNNGGNHDAASGQNTNGQHVNDSNSATTGSPALNTTFNTEGTQPMMAGQRQPSITAASNRTMATRMSNAFTTFATQNVSGGNTTPGVAAANTAVPVANTAALRQHIMTIQERINRAHQVLQHPGSNEATRQHAQNVIQESTSYLTVLLRKVQEMQMNQPQSNVNAASTSTPGSTTPATSGVNMPATSAGNASVIETERDIGDNDSSLGNKDPVQRKQQPPPLHSLLQVQQPPQCHHQPRHQQYHQNLTSLLLVVRVKVLV